MKIPNIDETKLPIVKEIIEDINHFVIDENCDADSLEIQNLAKKLRETVGKEDLSIDPFLYYSSYTTLDDVAMMALLPTPQKSGLSDEEIKEIILKIANVEFEESITDYFLKVLKLETGLRNIIDYIFNPNQVGLDLHASTEEIIEKIMHDKK